MRLAVLVVAVAAAACSGGGEPAGGGAGARAKGEPAAAEAVTVEPMGAVLAHAAAHKGRPEKEQLPLEVGLEHLPPLHADCAAGSEVACVVFTMAYASALEQARAAGRSAIDALASDCAGDKRMRCLVAAEALDDPGGTSVETGTALAQLKKLCDGGLAFACVRVSAIRLASGIDTPVISEADARAHIARGCADRILTACSMEVQLAGAIPPPEEFAASNQYRTRVRACEVGDIGECLDIVELVRPAPPFGCSQCDADAAANNDWINKVTGFHDERCRDCDIVKCRRENCCPTCAGKHHACCGDEGGPPTVYPDAPPPPDPARWRAASSAAREGTRRGLALWKAGCARQVPAWCELAGKLEAELATLDRAQQP